MFKLLYSMRWVMKPNWWRFLIILVLGISLSFLLLLPPELVSKLTKAMENETLTYDLLINQVMIPYLIIVVSIYLVAVIKRINMNWLTTTIYRQLHKRYINSIMTQDATFFEKFSAGDLLIRATGDINTVKFSCGTRFINIILESITIIFTFVAMILIHPILAVCCFIPLILIPVLNILLRSVVKRNWRNVREKHSEMGNKVLESITNVRTIRSFSKEEDDYNLNIKYSDEAYRIEKKNLKVNVIFQPLFQFIAGISTIICYALGAYYYSASILTLSLLVKFIMYLNQFQSPLTNIGTFINNFYQSIISAERINEVYESKSLVIDNTDSTDLDEIKSIEYKNFSFKYPNDNYYILKDINLKINEGETIGIVGKTGSGKSTLVKILMRQYLLDNEKLLINNKEISSYNQESIRNKISYVPQEHILLSRSLYDNVLLGKEGASKDEILEAIELADFTKDVENLQYGLDTIVGEYGVTLSGGQKQRLSIARALLKNSDVLILDDSLSAVDGKTEANIIKTLNEKRKNKTNIIVSHRLTAVMHSNLIVVLDNGKIVESGNHDELMKNKGWYYNQFISQQMNKEANYE